MSRAVVCSLACALLVSACEVASAAPDPARKAAREAKRAAREAKRGEPPRSAAAPPGGEAAAAARSPRAAGEGLPACPPGNPLTFRSFGAGFLRTWCTGCHSSALAEGERQDAPIDVNFETRALYLPRAQDVYTRAVVEAHAIAVDPAASASPMPPAGLVPAADRRRLAQWIACGSP